jgi:hypothetical protein
MKFGDILAGVFLWVAMAIVGVLLGLADIGAI